MRISFRSNSIEQIPFFTFVSQRSFKLRRSTIFKSPLSYPEQTTRSTGLYESPNPTAQQSRRSSAFLLAGQIFATGSFGCRGSHTFTVPSRPPVTISGAPQFTVDPPIASSVFMMPS
uniref:Uncharacterized protein n=1 Tax=Anopheles culicifacies TaxID=139723 RepID=A0A182MCN9_9DIPT